MSKQQMVISDAIYCRACQAVDDGVDGATVDLQALQECIDAGISYPPQLLAA